MHNVRIAIRKSARRRSGLQDACLFQFLDEPVHESAVVAQLCGTKLSWLLKDAEQASSKLTRC